VSADCADGADSDVEPRPVNRPQLRGLISAERMGSGLNLCNPRNLRITSWFLPASFLQIINHKSQIINLKTSRCSGALAAIGSAGSGRADVPWIHRLRGGSAPQGPPLESIKFEKRYVWFVVTLPGGQPVSPDPFNQRILSGSQTVAVVRLSLPEVITGASTLG
jgi:hypothetical protein